MLRLLILTGIPRAHSKYAASGILSFKLHSMILFLIQFLIAILHRDLRNCFFFRHLSFTFHILFGLLFPLFYLDFCFPFIFDFYFFFWTFISFLDFYFSFGLLFPFLHKSRSDLGFLPSFCFKIVRIILHNPQLEGNFCI